MSHPEEAKGLKSIKSTTATAGLMVGPDIQGTQARLAITKLTITSKPLLFQTAREVAQRTVNER